MQDGSNIDMEALKNALEQLVQVMQGKMDYGEGDEAMEPGDMSEAMDGLDEQGDDNNNYNPIEAGDAEGVEESPEDDEGLAATLVDREMEGAETKQ